MGSVLVKLYQFAEQQGGATARLRLAMMTSIPSAKAASEPDSPENINKFKKAIKEITGKDAPNV